MSAIGPILGQAMFFQRIKGDHTAALLIFR
jgi:hypothetical protein